MHPEREDSKSLTRRAGHKNIKEGREITSEGKEQTAQKKSLQPPPNGSCAFKQEEKEQEKSN